MEFILVESERASGFVRFAAGVAAVLISPGLVGLDVVLHVVSVAILLPAQSTHPEAVTCPDHLLLCLLAQVADGGADYGAGPGHQLIIITSEAAPAHSASVKLGVEKRLRIS